MEDRIVGPLTMTQFVYLLVGGMLIYVAWLAFLPSTFWFAAVPIGLIAVSLAFLKVQDQPLPKFLGATLLYLIRPKRRIWQKEKTTEHLAIVHKKPSRPEEQSPVQTTPSTDELTSLAATLDTNASTTTHPTPTGTRLMAPPPSNQRTVPTPGPSATPLTNTTRLANNTAVDQLAEQLNTVQNIAVRQLPPDNEEANHGEPK